MAKADVRKLIARATAAVKKKYSGALPAVAADDLVGVGLWASTGSLALDRAIARTVPGGVPLGPKRGRVAHIFGDPSTGKSLILGHLFKSAQDLGGICVCSDTEGTWDPHFPEAIGLDLERLAVLRPRTIEELFDTGIAFVEEVRRADPDVPVLCGLDSLELVEAGRTFQVAMSGKEGGRHEFGGGRAAAIGAGCRKVANLCGRGQTSFVILNQVRENIGVMFGASKRPPGGLSPRFMASIEVSLARSRYGQVKVGDRVVGQWVHAKVVKNKVAEPFSFCDFLIRFDTGVQRWSGVLEQLEAEGRVTVERRGEKGPIAGREFVDVRTGEAVPLADFVAWCEREGALA